MQENIGYSVVDVQGDPINPNVVVVMGGLAMPKFGCSPEDVSKMIDEISVDYKPKIIGVYEYLRKNWMDQKSII